MRVPPLKPALWAVWGVLAVCGAAGAQGPAADAETNFDNVEWADGGVKDKVEILRVGTEPSANNLLSVFLGLRNKTAHELTVEIETIYKDSEGKPLNSGSWVAITLKPHEEREYRSTSISEAFDANAMNAPFLIRIRQAVAHG